MQDIINFVLENGTGIATAILAAHALAVAIVNLTPTPKDDEIVSKAYKVVEGLAGVLTKKAKD